MLLPPPYTSIVGAINGKLEKILPNTSNILQSAEALGNNAFSFYGCNGGSYTGSFPDSNYNYGFGIVINRSGTKVVIVFPERCTLPVIRNVYSDNKWSGWYDLQGNAR